MADEVEGWGKEGVGEEGEKSLSTFYSQVRYHGQKWAGMKTEQMSARLNICVVLHVSTTSWNFCQYEIKVSVLIIMPVLWYSRYLIHWWCFKLWMCSKRLFSSLKSGRLKPPWYLSSPDLCVTLHQLVMQVTFRSPSPYCAQCPKSYSCQCARKFVTHHSALKKNTKSSTTLFSMFMESTSQS